MILPAQHLHVVLIWREATVCSSTNVETLKHLHRWLISPVLPLEVDKAKVIKALHLGKVHGIVIVLVCWPHKRLQNNPVYEKCEGILHWFCLGSVSSRGVSNCLSEVETMGGSLSWSKADTSSSIPRLFPGAPTRNWKRRRMGPWTSSRLNAYLMASLFLWQPIRCACTKKCPTYPQVGDTNSSASCTWCYHLFLEAHHVQSFRIRHRHVRAFSALSDILTKASG